MTRAGRAPVYNQISYKNNNNKLYQKEGLNDNLKRELQLYNIQYMYMYIFRYVKSMTRFVIDAGSSYKNKGTKSKANRKYKYNLV